MSKTVKQIIMRDYMNRVRKTAKDGGVEVQDAMLISMRGIKAVDTTKLRSTLAKKNIRITVIRNSLARKAFEGTSLSALSELLTGASAIAYGAESVVEVAREVVELAGKLPALELRGAVLDGQLFKGKAGVEELSKFPTRDEAIGQAVTLILSPGRNIVGQVLGPGRKVGGIVKAIEEKLEKGEAIAKVG